jgi:hypothetical protein
MTQENLKKISTVVSAIGFSADIITLGLFFKDLFTTRPPLPFSSAITQIVIIIVAFTFSALLLVYSRSGVWGNPLDSIAWLFSWLYLLFSALIFAVIAYRFILQANYGIGDYFGYTALIALIAGLACSILLIVGRDFSYFSVPYMLTALEQIILWIARIIGKEPIRFDFIFVGNVLLFVYAGLFILAFIGIPILIQRRKEVIEYY